MCVVKKDLALVCLKKLFTFATQWFTFHISSKVIKRESGENPGQSRCCKLFKRIEQHFCH